MERLTEYISDRKYRAAIPKEHGRLGDLSELEERISNFISHDENIIDEKIVSREKFILDGIKDTLTIIEADKDGENGN